MSKRLDVLLAVKGMLIAALPGVEVRGLDGTTGAPDRVGPDGTCVIEAGDPGRPEIDLCPPTYNYEHQIPVTLDGVSNDALTAEQTVDEMIDLISAAIEADRFLGGMVDYLDATAPPTSDDYVNGAPGTATAELTITATYSTSHPL